MDGKCSTPGETRYSYKILVGAPRRKTPLGNPSKWEEIKIDLK
jgi:hypothetical protein